jgi:glutaredoxin
MNWLDAHKVDYEVLDVVADVEAYDEMLELSGQTMSPVLDVDGEILADFGPEELPGFFKRIATRDEPK